MRTMIESIVVEIGEAWIDEVVTDNCLYDHIVF